MNEYQIFSDSSCDLPEGMAEQNHISLIPFYITFNQETYYKENIDISNKDFYETLMKDKIFPKTSLPSVQDYINCFMPVLKRGQDILCFCLTQKFSGSYQSAMNAKHILSDEYPDAKIKIIDSIQATVGEGLLVLQAASMKAHGLSLDETVAYVEKQKESIRILFTVDTLEYLAKGGRIGKVTSLAGTMLNLKPLIQLKEGELIPHSKVRGRKKSLNAIVDMLEEYFKEIGAAYKDYEFALVDATTPEDAAILKETTEALTGVPIIHQTFPIGITIGTYTGPGAVGICFIKKYNNGSVPS